MNADSTPRPRPRKVPTPAVTPLKKPSPDFPLGVHKGTGYWCKKVKGQVHYFGKVSDDPKGVAALDEWLRVKDDLLAGREYPPDKEEESKEFTVADLCNLFLDEQGERRDKREISPRTWATYYNTCQLVCNEIGKQRTVISLTPADFRKLRQTLAKTRKAVALKNEIIRVRSLFKFAFEEGEILAPVTFGRAFRTPRQEIIDRDRQEKRMENGLRMFEAAELRLLLDYLDGKEVVIGTDEDGKPIKKKGKVKTHLKAMLLLAANSGFGNTDLANVPMKALDLNGGWVDFARVKNATPRKIPLWPETVEAIRAYLPNRPRAHGAEESRLVFLTRRGCRWVHHNEKGSPTDYLGQEFGKLLRQLNLKRPGVSVYALRHGFETIASETTDQVAVDAIMGHKAKGMAGIYRERIGDDRLQRVTEHVRKWLFDETATGTILSTISPEPN